MNTNVQNQYAERVNQLKAQLFGQVENLFFHEGLTMPMKLLHNLASEMSARIHEDKEELISREYIADTMYETTLLMWMLAEMYETHEGLQSVIKKMEMEAA